MKRAYELMIIIDADVVSSDIDAEIRHVANLITSEGASIASTDNWGMRQFAYEINKKNVGTYVVWELVTDTPGLPNMERQLRISDTIVRHKLFRLPNHEATERGLFAEATKV